LDDEFLEVPLNVTIGIALHTKFYRAAKIPWNFCCRRLRDEKFHGIPDIDIYRMEKSIIGT
jgi:hypothetical protein